MKKGVYLDAHAMELESDLFTTIRIKKESFERLSYVATNHDKTPEEVIEGFIDDIYNYLNELEEEDVKKQKDPF